jgi:hypothetical protein
MSRETEPELARGFLPFHMQGLDLQKGAVARTIFEAGRQYERAVQAAQAAHNNVDGQRIEIVVPPNVNHVALLKEFEAVLRGFVDKAGPG